MNLVVSHWSANVAVLAVGLAAVAVHVAGLAGLRSDTRRGGAALPAGLAREATAFYCGLLLAVLALVSPLGYWAGTFIWVRVLQDIVLGVYVPPLLVLGAPWLVLWRGLGRDPRPRAAPPPATAASAPARLRSWPVAVTALFVVVWCGWYLPVLYDAGVHHPVVLAAQAVTTMGAGVLLWLQIIGSRPFTPQFGPLYRVMLLAAIVLFSTILGMVLGFDARVLYPAYLGVGSHHLLTVVSDQQGGGAELWVLVLEPYVIAGVALLVRWLNEEESQALSQGLDRMLRPPKHTWPTRTGPR
jgi:cytochrome c oxidase assembly factor CtaG